MWMIILRTLEVGFVIGGIVASGIAGHLWLRAQKYRATAEGNEKVIDQLAKSTNAWKTLFDAEHLEYNEYRQKQHTTNNEANDRIIALTNENAELRAKTDLSPVLQFQKEQNSFNEKFLEALNAIIERIENGRPAKQKKKPGG